MKFFVPYVTDATQARAFQATAKFAQRPIPPMAERLFRLKYMHNGQVYEVKVGEPLPADDTETMPTVIAIFGGNPLLICTRDRGVARKSPVYVSTQSVIEAEYFDVVDDC